jgi:hypothetical protein
MFDIIDLPRTPKWARLVIAWSLISRIEISNAIRDLAAMDLIECSTFDNIGVVLDNTSRNVIQRAVDWSMRSIIFDDEAYRARSVALCGMRLLNAPGQTIILTKHTDFSAWQKLADQIWSEPYDVKTIIDDKKSDSSLLITNQSWYKKYRPLKDYRPDRIILDIFRQGIKCELNDSNWLEAIFKETPHLSIITKMENWDDIVWRQGKRRAARDLISASVFIIKHLIHYDSNLAHLLLSCDNIEQLMQEAGYPNCDASLLLGLLPICAEFLLEPASEQINPQLDKLRSILDNK